MKVVADPFFRAGLRFGRQSREHFVHPLQALRTLRQALEEWLGGSADERRRVGLTERPCVRLELLDRKQPGKRDSTGVRRMKLKCVQEDSRLRRWPPGDGLRRPLGSRPPNLGPSQPGL